MTEKDMQAAEADGLEKKFKMNTTMTTGNMVCFDLNGKIKKYKSAEEILADFYHKRLEFYGLRKVSLSLTVADSSNSWRMSSTSNSSDCPTKLALFR